MEASAKISHTSALILQTLGSGYVYGFDLMEVTGLPSGTIYPALRRLERESLIVGSWEEKRSAFSLDRPRRRYPCWLNWRPRGRNRNLFAGKETWK
jgi:PadR family transcriptional regulator, regulatory protein PadR